MNVTASAGRTENEERGRAMRPFPTALWLLTGVLVLGHFLWASLADTAPGQGGADILLGVASGVGAMAYSAGGWAIVTRQPRNTIGWLLMAFPVLLAIGLLAGDYATYGLALYPGSLPFARAAAWVDGWALVPLLGCLVPLVLLFPDGRIPSRRWRPALWLAIGGPVLATAGLAIAPRRLLGTFATLTSVVIANPLGIDFLAGPIDAATAVGTFLTLLAAALAVAAIVIRFRRSQGEARQQIRWMASVAVIFFVTFSLTVLTNVVVGRRQDIGRFLGDLLFSVTALTLVLGIPAACVIAILRYRLYDLDLVLRKTVVFTALGVFLATVYGTIVGGLGALVGSRSNTIASFIAAAVLAVAFAPARDRASRLADRLVYGRRATPYEVLTEFSIRVASTYRQHRRPGPHGRDPGRRHRGHPGPGLAPGGRGAPGRSRPGPPARIGRTACGWTATSCRRSRTARRSRSATTASSSGRSRWPCPRRTR